jgi:hypothetical protein
VTALVGATGYTTGSFPNSVNWLFVSCSVMTSHDVCQQILPADTARGELTCPLRAAVVTGVENSELHTEVNLVPFLSVSI